MKLRIDYRDGGVEVWQDVTAIWVGDGRLKYAISGILYCREPFLDTISSIVCDGEVIYMAKEEKE
jgi:hypothetical protein